MAPNVHLIAAATTSGTGSESTQFATFYKNKVKMSLDHISVLPKLVLMDPGFTVGLPKFQTASTGADALCQAIESFWNINSTNESKEYAKKAIQLAFENLKEATLEGSSESRLAMSEASYLAGKAINITRTTAPHAISYPMTSHFGVSHGEAVALSLPEFLQFNSFVSEKDCNDKRGDEFVRTQLSELIELFDCSTVDGAVRKLKELFLSCGLRQNLTELGIDSDKKIDVIIENGFNPARVKNNPRRLDTNSLRTLLENIRA